MRLAILILAIFFSCNSNDSVDDDTNQANDSIAISNFKIEMDKKISCDSLIMKQHPFFTDFSDDDSSFLNFRTKLFCAIANRDNKQVWKFFDSEFIVTGQYDSYKGNAFNYFKKQKLWFNGNCKDISGYLEKNFAYGFIPEKKYKAQNAAFESMHYIIDLKKGNVFVSLPFNKKAVNDGGSKICLEDNVNVYTKADFNSKIKSKFNMVSYFEYELGCANENNDGTNCMLTVIYNNGKDTGYVDANKILDLSESQDIFFIVKTKNGWKIKAQYKSPGC